MKYYNISDLEYLRLNKWQKFICKFIGFFVGIGRFFKRLGLKIGRGCKKLYFKFINEMKLLFNTIVKGSWKSKVSVLIMGFGNLSRKQWAKGLLFLAFEGIFITYMITTGSYWLSKFSTLGTVGAIEVYDEITDAYVTVYNDDSFKILLYGLITILFIVAFVVTWALNMHQCAMLDKIEAEGKKVKSNKDDLRSMVDDEFHKTLLALPVLGILFFTVMPIIFMILVAFTNYDVNHDGYKNLFTWVGWSNFNTLLSFTSGSNFMVTFGEVLSWTLIWAVFATFTNYFLGMLVAMLINKKGIRLKKIWRGILVLTIAVPQFISLLYISKMFSLNGIVNGIITSLGGTRVDFWGTTWLARLMVILINIWIGIPYLMLICTGVLMNIPKDLYESAKIDGANGFQQYAKITLPYMLFVTGPYLLTQFIGNINNFNVIYLLTGGLPTKINGVVNGTATGDTDLLITWLFNMVTGANPSYYTASIIGILIFIVVSVLSLIVYNVMPSTKNEEDFS